MRCSFLVVLIALAAPAVLPVAIAAPVSPGVSVPAAPPAPPAAPRPPAAAPAPPAVPPPDPTLYTIAGFQGDQADSKAAGFHKLCMPVRVGDQRVSIPFVIGLPVGYDKSEDKKPLLVFLQGAGERGTDLGGVFAYGIMADLRRRPDIAQWAPFILFDPQCPPDMRWDTPGMNKAVVEMIDAVCRKYRVDPDRIYLTGLSMGGTGCWHVALEAPKKFAVIAPIVANEVQPEAVAAKLHDAGVTVLMVSGGADPISAPGSRKMAAALAAQKVDVTLAEVPRAGHFTWSPYYGDQRYYEWILSHRRSAPAPADRMNAQQLIDIALTANIGPDAVQKRLAEDFKKFLPYWIIDNCGREMAPGLYPLLGGRKNVFVTHPVNGDIACRLMTTATIPTGKKTVLRVTAGHHPQGDWDLIIRVNEKEIQRQTISAAKSKDGWLAVETDLTPYAGSEVHLQLFNQIKSGKFSAAYWGAVEIVSQ